MIKKTIKETIRLFLNETQNDDMTEFLIDKKFINTKSKIFLYHGTKIPPDNFNLKDEYNFEDSNTWSGDLPDGCLFLTTDITEAKAYGKYVIPCELKAYDNITFKVNSDSPSVIFDRDYGVDLYRNDKYFGFWEKFDKSGKTNLIIKGTNRSTIITYVENVIPRTDLAIQFYNSIKKDKTVKENLNESNISDNIVNILNTTKVYDLFFNGKPSSKGWKISIVGKKMEDVYDLYGRLHNWLFNKNIAHKIGTRKRLESNVFEQNRKIFTIYVPDDMDIRKLLINIEYLLKGYIGWHDIKLPFNGYEVYSGGISFRNDRNEYGDYIPTKDIKT